VSGIEDPGRREVERLELHLSYTCTNRCLFCSERHRMRRFEGARITLPMIGSLLRSHAARGVRHLHLTGGEPTLHPHFLDAAALARRLGMRTSAGTNGAVLCREDFATRALPLLAEIMFSLHGPVAEVHDAHTRTAGSFGSVVRALTLAAGSGRSTDLAVNTVVTRGNVDLLPDTLALARDLGASLIVVSNVSPEGAGLDRFGELAVPLEELAEVLPGLPDLVPGVLVRFFGVPQCVLGGRASIHSNDLYWDPRVTVEWSDAGGVPFLDELCAMAPDRKRVHVPRCAGCLNEGICMGVFDECARTMTTDALVPFGSQAR